jgi:preprotein translocase SecE subunit
MAGDRQRQRRRRPRPQGPQEPDVGLPADDVDDAGIGHTDPDGPLGQAMPDVTEARLAEAGAEPPSVGGRGGRGPVEEHEVVHGGPRKGLFGRAADFIRASWNELKRVQWPDRRQVGQGTAVVVGFVVVAGLYLGALDAIWNPLIQKIL